MLIIFWVITPLFGTIFTTRDIEYHLHTNVNYRYSIPSPSEQVEELTNRFWLGAYDHIWANASLPGFTTEDSTLLPFDLDSTNPQVPVHNATWSAPTKKYWTQLQCSNAQIDANQNVSSNGQDCTTGLEVGDGVPGDDGMVLMYFGYWSSQYSTYSLQGQPGCSQKKNQHMFLGALKNLSQEQHRHTMIYCQPSYWQQDVNVTVFRSNLSVEHIEPVGPTEPLSDAIFNNTNFEYILNAQSPKVSKRADIVDSMTFLDYSWRLQQKLNLNLSSSSFTPLMGLGVALNPLPLEAYLNAESAAITFGRAHQILFALALQSLIRKGPNATSSLSGIESYTCPSILVLRHFAMGVEILLGMIVIFACAMIWLYRQRPSEISENPGSLREIIRLIETPAAHEFTLAPGDQSKSDARIRLKEGKIQREHESLFPEPVSTHRDTVHSACSSYNEIMKHRQGKQSWELRQSTGVVFTCLIFIVLVLLTTFYVLAKKWDGLHRPSRNDTINQLVTNYIPVAFATFLEPFWTLLTRILCVLRPFEALLNGDTPIGKSISLRYTALPPQLAFWLALHENDKLLVAVCLIGLSSNVLAVALSGLFTSQTVLVESPLLLEHLHAPVYDRVRNDSVWLVSKDSDILPITAYTLQNGASLPPWIQGDNYSVPFKPSVNTSGASDEIYAGTTTGFGIDLTCQEVKYNATNWILEGSPYAMPPPVDLGNGTTCAIAQVGIQGGQNKTRMASEILLPLAELSNNQTQSESGCSSAILTGFLRGNISTSWNDSKTDNRDNIPNERQVQNINSLSSLWMVCQQTFQAATYNVSVDQSGRVKTSTQIGSYRRENGQLFTENLNSTVFNNRTRDIWVRSDGTRPWWHNDSYVDSVSVTQACSWSCSVGGW